VTSRGPFRAVSLDLWFTILYYPLESEIRWKEDRLRALGEILRTRSGERFSASDLESAVNAVRGRLAAQGRDTVVVDPQALVTAYAESLDATLSVPPDEAGRRLSSVGLSEHPPLVNPEVAAVVEVLEARRIPVIAITNTNRREESWQDFLGSRANLHLKHIVTSCEVGSAKPDPEIFFEASRRLGVPPAEILHVGDRWELDVDGALRSGCGAALYRGLWSFYPLDFYPRTDLPETEYPDVLRIDRLDELLRGDLLRGPD